MNTFTAADGAQSMMGGINAHYDCVKELSQTDFISDLKKFNIPALLLHGDADQIVPITGAPMLSAKLIPHAKFKVYAGAPHGVCATHADLVNADLLAFLKS